ncbi:MAG: hypothetical protein ACI8ZO_001350 [Flavobacteriales bacterium]|jgi:hypothetical protein
MKKLIILFLLIASNAIAQSPQVITTFYRSESFYASCREKKAKYVEIEEKLNKDTFSRLIKEIATDKIYHFSKYIDGVPCGLWVHGKPSSLKELDYDFTSNYTSMEFPNTPIHNAMSDQGFVVDAEFQKVISRHLLSNFQFPQLAIDQNILGKVFVSFLINMNGAIVYAYVARGVSPILDKEALRLIYGLSPLTIIPKDPNASSNTLFSYSIPVNFQIY